MTRPLAAGPSIDIKASRGMVIRSARDGRVAYSGWMGGYGKVIVESELMG